MSFRPSLPHPSRADLEAARDRTLRDVIAPRLKVLFCGINPGLYSAATGWHFGRPGNRFWRVLHAAGFTERLLHPSEQHELLSYGYGITNLAERATATADELSAEELMKGGARLEKKVRRYRPEAVAVLGVSAFRTGFGQARAKMGQQPEKLVKATLWVLPSPSGLNAHYRLDELAIIFLRLRESLEASPTHDG